MTESSVRQGKRDVRFEPVNDDRGLGVYCLTLRESPGGRFYVERGEWWLWGGKITAMNHQRVSPYYIKRESTRTFCLNYTADHPGCKSGEQARAIANGALA